MQSCTVVLVDVGEATEAIRRLLTDWVDHRLIRAPLWLERDEHECMATQWLGQQDELDGVLGALSAEPYELIRVINLVVDHGDGDTSTYSPEREPAAGEALYREIDAALAPAQRLVRINLAVPTTPTGPLSSDVFVPPTAPNVLIAPVCRISPAHVSTPLTTPTQPGHAAAALATIGALWIGMVEGPYDRPPEGQPQPGVRVARVFGRIVQLEGAVTGVATEALQRRRSEAHVAQAAQGVVAPEPAKTAAEVGREFLRVCGTRLGFRPPGPPQSPPQQTVSILAAFAAMLRYVLRGLREFPVRLATGVVSAVQDRLGRVAQEMTFGSDSLVAVTFGGRPRSADSANSSPTDATEAAAQFAQDLLRQATGESATPPAMGEVWAALRGTVFGLHDGSDFPKSITAPMDGRARLVVTDPGMLTPDPEPGPLRLSEVPAHFAPIVHAPIRPCDAFQAAQVAEVLDQGGRVPELPAGLDGAAPSQALDPSTEDRVAAARLRAQLDAWVQEREAALLWRLCRETGDALTAAQQALIDALNRIVAGSGSVDQRAADAAARRLRRGWALISLLVLAASIGTYLLYPQLGVAASTILILIHVIVSLVVWIALLLWRFVRYQRELFRLRYQHDRRHAAYVHALRTSTEIAHRVVELASAYEQLRAWAEVLGWVLHHPQGPVQLPPRRAQATGPADVPVNLGVAVGTLGEASTRRLGALVGDELFGVGWAGKLYERYLTASMERVRFEDGLADRPEPDWQLSRPWPLDTLLDDLASGEVAEWWTREILRRVAAELAAIEPGDVIVTSGDGSRPADEHLREIVDEQDRGERICPLLWTDEARNTNAHVLTQSVRWAPAGLAAVPNDLENRAEIVADPEDDMVILCSLRFDTTDPARTTDLKGCARPAPEGPEYTGVAYEDGGADAL